MNVVVRRLRDDELRLYLQIHTAAIQGLATSHYDPATIAGWMVPITDDNLRDLQTNVDQEIRLIAELEGQPVGIGALVVEHSELRACYVHPDAARHGVGTAIVHEIERLAKEHGLSQLQLAGSLNAEAFYVALGYSVRERSDVVLGNGHRMAAVWMEKRL